MLNFYSVSSMLCGRKISVKSIGSQSTFKMQYCELDCEIFLKSGMQYLTSRFFSLRPITIRTMERPGQNWSGWSANDPSINLNLQGRRHTCFCLSVFFSLSLSLLFPFSFLLLYLFYLLPYFFSFVACVNGV